MKKIKVVVKRVGQPGTVETIENKLESYQGIVGGWIEVVYLRDGIVMVCNEEGKLDGLAPNLVFTNDYIAGNIIFCSERNEDFVSLTDAQIITVEAIISNRSVYTSLDELND